MSGVNDIVYLYSQCLNKHCNRSCLHFNPCSEFSNGDITCSYCFCSRSLHRRYAMIWNGKLNKLDENGNLIEQVTPTISRECETPLQCNNINALKGYLSNVNPTNFQTTDAEKRFLFACKTKSDLAHSDAKAKPKFFSLKSVSENSIGLNLIVLERTDPLPQSNTNYNCLLESKRCRPISVFFLKMHLSRICSIHP